MFNRAKEPDYGRELWNELRQERPDEQRCSTLVRFDRDFVQQTDAGGVTMLMLAAQKNMSWLVKVMIDLGASVTAADSQGRTPMHYVAARGMTLKPSENVIRKLRDTSADLDVRDIQGRTPLHCAVASRNLEAMRLLVALGANAQLCDNNGDNPAQLLKKMNLPAPYAEALVPRPKEKKPSQPLTVKELGEARDALRTAFRLINLPGPKPDPVAHALAIANTTQALLDVDARLREAKKGNPAFRNG